MTLSGLGGDAWTFRKQIEGEAYGCTDIEVVSEQQRVLAQSFPAPDSRAGGGEATRVRFAATVTLQSGDNRLRARCRGEDGWVTSAVQRWHVPMSDRPSARVRVTLSDAGIVLDGGASLPGEANAAPIVAWHWSLSRPAPVTPMSVDGMALSDGWQGVRRVLDVPAQDGEYFVALEVRDALGRTDRSEARFSVRNGDLDRQPQDAAAWLDAALIYGAAPSLLGRDALDRLRAHLDTIQHMGSDTLWLAPIYPRPGDDYGYAVLDPMGVAESLGGERALRALIAEAHSRGIRVLLDFVPNHTSDAHGYFQHAQRHGKASPYFAYYQRDGEGRPVHYFTWENLPNLDYDHPEVRRWMGEALAHWVREFDVDGFRLDVAWGVYERAPEFFHELRGELRRLKADVVLLGEATAREPAFVDSFDAAYDWTWEPGEWSWQAAFHASEAKSAGAPRVDLAQLHDALTVDGEGWPPGARVVRFLNNNDTGARFVTRHGHALHRVATALLFTVPGIPSVFMGDEWSAEYEPYQIEEPITLTSRSACVSWIRRLIEVRRASKALREGAFVSVVSAPSDDVYAYLRAVDGEPPVLIVLNFSSRTMRASLALPIEWAKRIADGRVTDILNTDHASTARMSPCTDDATQTCMLIEPFAVRILQ